MKMHDVPATASTEALESHLIDAYAVDVLRREEQGAAVGARTALYRAAMFISGGIDAYNMAAAVACPA